MTLHSPDDPRPKIDSQVTQPATAQIGYEQSSEPPPSDRARFETVRGQLEVARVACDAARSQLLARQAEFDVIRAGLSEKQSQIELQQRECTAQTQALITERTAFGAARDAFELQRTHVTAELAAVESAVQVARSQLAAEQIQFQTDLAALAEKSQAELKSWLLQRDEQNAQVTRDRILLDAVRAEVDSQQARLTAAQAELVTQRSQWETEQRQFKAARAEFEVEGARCAAEQAQLLLAHTETDRERSRLAEKQAALLLSVPGACDLRGACDLSADDPATPSGESTALEVTSAEQHLLGTQVTGVPADSDNCQCQTPGLPSELVPFQGNGTPSGPEPAASDQVDTRPSESLANGSLLGDAVLSEKKRSRLDLLQEPLRADYPRSEAGRSVKKTGSGPRERGTVLVHRDRVAEYPVTRTSRPKSKRRKHRYKLFSACVLFAQFVAVAALIGVIIFIIYSANSGSNPVFNAGFKR